MCFWDGTIKRSKICIPRVRYPKVLTLNKTRLVYSLCKLNQLSAGGSGTTVFNDSWRVSWIEWLLNPWSSLLKFYTETKVWLQQFSVYLKKTRLLHNGKWFDCFTIQPRTKYTEIHREGLVTNTMTITWPGPAVKKLYLLDHLDLNVSTSVLSYLGDHIPYQ